MIQVDIIDVLQIVQLIQWIINIKMIKQILVNHTAKKDVLIIFNIMSKMNNNKYVLLNVQKLMIKSIIILQLITPMNV